MSWGISPYDFVQQVFYAQEKVLLDFWPSDDKYKEVLMEANLVLQELQNAEDWSWLRDRLKLGSTDVPNGTIPEYTFPSWVYKVSQLHNDCVRLYRAWGGAPHSRLRCPSHHSTPDGLVYDERDFIEVPYVSQGRLNRNNKDQRFLMDTNVSHVALGASVVGDTLTFTRPMLPHEKGRIAICDVQRRFTPIHVCGPKCKGVDPKSPISYELDDEGNWKNPCAQIEDKLFTEIPDPNYMVMRTAALHAAGSPPAQGRIADLTDNASKILSAMRQNDNTFTDSDYLDWEPIEYVNVI